MTPLLANWTAVCAATLSLCAATARSDDAVLYGDAVPTDAAFIRVLSEGLHTSEFATFAGAEFPVSADTLDTYFAVSAAQLDGVTEGAFYSLIDGPTGQLAIAEPAREAVAKVHLILLNTGHDPVRLIVPDNGLEVIKALETGQAASRAVNPIEIGLAVERVSDGTHLGSFDVRLSRGRNLTFVVSDTSARMIENTVGQVLKLN